jgi:hypothetical protein
MVAKIGLILPTYFFGCRLFAVMGIRFIEFDTHSANVQLCVTGFANIKPPQRQTESS